jgi:hypothetical protein
VVSATRPSFSSSGSGVYTAPELLTEMFDLCVRSVRCGNNVSSGLMASVCACSTSSKRATEPYDGLSVHGPAEVIYSGGCQTTGAVDCVSYCAAVLCT